MRSKEDIEETELSSLKKTKKAGGASLNRRRVVLLLVKIALFATLCYVVFFVMFGVTRMEGSSMYPAVRDGDLLVYYRLEGQYENGDVVIVDMNGREVVMRIVGSGGQELEIREEKELLVDGQPSTFRAFYETERAEAQGFKYPYKVSEDCYFMLNDYRDNKEDSRTFGEVCKDKIKGRLITKIQIRDL